MEQNETGSSGPSIGRQLPDLLRSFLNLRAVALAGKLGEDVSTILEILSRVKDLKKLSLNARDKFEWTNELASIFRGGFRQVSRLSLKTAQFTMPAQSDNSTCQPSGSIPVKRLYLSLKGDSSQGSRFAKEVFSTLHLDTVQTATIFGSLTYYSSIEQLLLCPNLSGLHISCSRNNASRTFSSILPFLPRFPSLHHVDIRLIKPTGSPYMQSPVTLSAIVASFPSSLRSFRADQFVFPDFETFPVRSTPHEPLRKLQGLSPLNAGQSMPPLIPLFKRLFIWEEEEAGGCTRWYRLLKGEWKHGNIREQHSHPFLRVSVHSDTSSSDFRKKLNSLSRAPRHQPKFLYHFPRYVDFQRA
jgi:hypothetical protein